MAVTILERPQGQVLSTTGIQARIDDAYGSPDASVYSVGHGLSDGAFVYITSNIEDYNGFFYVDSTGADTFKIKQYSSGDYVQFIQDTDITYYVSSISHGWSAVHLPITYRLSSNLYPLNSADTTRNITSVTDANGYSVIHLSGSLGTGVNSYDFVRITAPNDTELSGVYQILEFISPTVMIINLEYDSANNFASATALKEYNNYNIIVRLYAGIASGHEWAAQKPMELAATLELIPDENNEVFFSINEILKSYIETRNNLLLGTLPNNIDFWNNFYIEYAESYDDSDGYALGTYTSSYTSDEGNFLGYSVNADLEFKNLYSGYMSEYLMNNSTAKFLTLFAIPVLFGCTDDVPECYNEVTFIKPSSGDYVLNKQYYSNGNAGLLEQDTVSGDEGVYRVPIEPNCDYDRVDITLGVTISTPLSDVSKQIDFSSGSTWSYSIPYATTLVGLSGGQNTTDIIAWDNILQPGSYNVSYQFFKTQNTNTATFYAYGLDENDNIIYTQLINSLIIGTQTSSFIFTPNVAIAAFGIRAGVSGGGADPTVRIEALLFTSGVSAKSETKQFKIDCGCSKQELRLTWLNNLGGFDYWKFTANKDLIVEITETGETRKNILPQWPKSYGANADTIRRQTFRVSNKAYTVRSQYITQSEADAIAYIKSSVLVQIINSRQDRRTVIVDSDSFVVYPDGADLYSIAFNVSFTDDIPSQTV